MESILELTVFSLLGLSIAVCLCITWLPPLQFIEPIAIGLVALSLGSLCFPGLLRLDKAFGTPQYCRFRATIHKRPSR